MHENTDPKHSIPNWAQDDQLAELKRERDHLKQLLRSLMYSGDAMGLRSGQYTVVLNEKLFKAACEAIK